jgi:hypothetical protein
MTTKFNNIHRFNDGQLVKFIGGEGIIKSFKFEGRVWTYLVEMPMGIEPKFGRVGAETMVLLKETELRAA